jgi:4-hydroxybenzoate polyprenyltransferase
MNFASTASILRVNQWYKNTIIFVPLVFSLKFFSFEAMLLSFLGFLALCLVSSAGYIRNDIIDLESDKLHPTKKSRPLPSGKITFSQSVVLLIGILSVGLFLSFLLEWKFFIISVLLLINTEIYSNWIKKIIFLDILSISGNFLLRAISGVILIESPFSPWLILGIFFIALFLAAIKRRNEIITLKDMAEKHRHVLTKYTEHTLNSIILISTVMIITTYSLYTMNSYIQDWRLVITVPIVVYVMFRQTHLSTISNEKNLSDNLLKDKGTGIAVLVYIILTIYLLYFAPSEFFVN